MFNFLKKMAGNASDAFSIIETRSAAAAQAVKDALNLAVTNSFSAVQRAISAQKTSINDMLSTANANISDLTGVSNDLGSALKALRGNSDQAVASLRAQAQATLQNALAKARSGGSLANFEGLSDALATVSDHNTDLYSSLEDFNRDQGRTANVVAELNRLNGKQLTSAEQTAKTLQEQLERLDDQLEFAQAQLDMLNGVDNSVMSVTAAVNAMNAAVVAALKGGAGAGAGAPLSPANAVTAIQTAYRNILGREADAPGLAAWTGALANGASLEQVLASIKASAAANGQLAGHATGGLISGPGTGTSDSILARLSNGEFVMTAAAVRAFGTDALSQMNSLQIPAFAAGGPVLDVAAPSQVFTASKPTEPARGGGQAAEVREMFVWVKQVVGAMKVNSDKVQKKLEQWEKDGLPPTTTASVTA